MSNESKIVLSNKQNGTTTEIVDSNSESNVSKKFLLPDESGKLLTEEKTNLMYLTKDIAESKYRKLEDSYSKAQTDNKLSEKLAVSEYNTDKGTFATKNELGLKADKSTTYTKTETYTKSEVDDRVMAYSYPRGETYNKSHVDLFIESLATSKANRADTYNKYEVDDRVNVKANSNAVVGLSGNQTINGVKTFSALPVCNILPTADTHLANRNYVKKRGGFVAITGGAIDLNRGMNFSLNLTAATNITVANAAANIGQTGEIYVANGANIRAFNAPFNFRVAQSGFGANEIFSYLVVSANLVRITRS